MTLNEWLRAIAGTFVLLSVALGWFVHPAFFLFTAFVGANLLQSAFTKTCPMMGILRWLGVRDPGVARVKLVVLVVPREVRDDAEAALESVGAFGFTEVPSVYGEGFTGPRFGSRVAPGVSDLIFVAVQDATVGPVRAALAAVETRLGRKLHAFVLPAEEIEFHRP